jgi:hypothetical protein
MIALADEKGRRTEARRRGSTQPAAPGVALLKTWNVPYRHNGVMR